MKTSLPLFLLAAMLITPQVIHSKTITSEKIMIKIIPRPEKVLLREGSFTLDANTKIVDQSSAKLFDGTIKYLIEKISGATGYKLQTADSPTKTTSIIFLENKKLLQEAYHLVVEKDKIIVHSSSAEGAFYAVQSLLQLMPPQIFSNKKEAVVWNIPCINIEDAPRYKWRGMQLDVSRHFFPKEFIKNYIDYIAMYKLNRFHWHLVDDQGWRIEIKKYPKLTDIGAWRVDREDMSWRERERQKDGEVPTYGGFYTQEDIKEIVAYAADRHVEILPEIEMPAHVLSALSAYPELSCTGGPFTVPPGTYWPNIDIYCAGKEKTFEFLEDVLNEVIELFPCKYIHIGGDEADKTEWKKCPDCQRRIKEEGLRDEAELQSYFIKRIEKFLISKNKRLIGWDEILEGGLAPEATVMSWRGMQGGIDAAKQGHDVIMTPMDYCYFNFYQGKPEFEPEAFGGFLPLKTVYQFEPTPAELSATEAEHVLGGQANLWTEFIGSPDIAEYMIFPRIAALAEVDWTQKELRDWKSFQSRINHQFEIYENMGVHYSKSLYTVYITPKPDENRSELFAALETESSLPEIYYSTDGTEPGLASLKYNEPVKIENSITLKAISFINGIATSRISEQKFYKHIAFLKKPLLKYKYADNYKGGGDYGLTNGIVGSENYGDGCWSGFYGVDLDAVIDLGENKSVKKLSAGFLQKISSWIFLPSKVEYYISSDGTNYTLVGEVVNDASDDKPDNFRKDFTFEIKSVETRYIKVVARSIGVCPEGHAGAGKKAWLFADEIVVE
ncbi:MAG: family 20 glycosylhydrolase [Ignavibacteriaceae bacterium]|nr:family 20 glycosylhydrolase [Ignavibacteriaceae bacterium]